ncbi:hypothetical protein BVW01_23315 [Mycobacterium tuberculosis]|nr:hypothetical protein BVW01_23315 [Mycobacterium tuberculosis]
MLADTDQAWPCGAGSGAGPVTGMMPGMASAAKGTGAYAGPRYGFKPTVMPKQVVV